MTRPGVEILTRDLSPPRSIPTDTGVWFVAGLAERGVLAPVEITSMTAYALKHGSRSGFTTLYDSVETFFREGGSRVYVSRVLATDATTAVVNLSDGTNPTMSVSAKSPGSWGNSLTVQVIAGSGAGTFVLIIALGGTEVERSPDLLDKDAAFAWDDESNYVVLGSLAGTGDPVVVGATPLAGGGNGSSVTDSDWESALNRFAKDLGPGQVSQPGRSSTQAHRDTLEHALNNNRVAILDAPDTATKATLVSAGQAFRAAADKVLARFGAAFAPWVVVPGVTAGTFRTVPPSALIAGLVARSDAVSGNPNVPAAGGNGIARWAVDLSQNPFTDTDRGDLNLASINVIREIYAGIRVYGWRSLVDPVAQQPWIDFGNGRLYMAIAADANVIAEGFVFDQIDGQGVTINQFGAELTAVLVPYFDLGALYGATPDEAFFVDVGEQVNTPETIATNTLKAILSVRMSPFAELVQIEIVKVPVTEAVV